MRALQISPMKPVRGVTYRRDPRDGRARCGRGVDRDRVAPLNKHDLSHGGAISVAPSPTVVARGLRPRRRCRPKCQERQVGDRVLAQL